MTIIMPIWTDHYFHLSLAHTLIHTGILPRQPTLKQTYQAKPQTSLLKTAGQHEFKAGWDCQNDAKVFVRAVGFVSFKKETYNFFLFLLIHREKWPVWKQSLAQEKSSLELFWFIPAKGKSLFSWGIIHICAVLESAGQMIQEEEGVKRVCDLKDS